MYCNSTRILMHELRLLERLHDAEAGGNDDRTPSERASASVLGYLVKILNTRQGSAQIAKDFGIPDFTNIASSYGVESVPDIERAIEQVIATYEPRLTDVHVTYDPRKDDPLAIPFTLQASLVLDGQRVPVVFETVLGSDGRIAVSS